MLPTRDIWNSRRLGASGALIATGAGITALGLETGGFHWFNSSLVVAGGALALAGVGLSRKSMVVQVVSRASAWLVLVPAALVTLASALGAHHPDLVAAALSAGSGAALLLGTPMLHTPEARAAFAPSRFRSWLLAGATASAALGMVTALLGLSRVLEGWGSLGAALLALAAALIGSAVGVIRMRTWGILLGGLTGAVTVIAGVFLARHNVTQGLLVSLLATPGLLFFVAPVLVARRTRAEAPRNDRPSAA